MTLFRHRIAAPRVLALGCALALVSPGGFVPAAFAADAVAPPKGVAAGPCVKASANTP